MRASFLQIAVCGGLLLAAVEVGAQTNAPQSAPPPASIVKREEASAVPENDLRSFKIIAERNIFNPNRSSRSSRNSNQGPPPKQVKIETFAMVGMLSSEKGLFAFFDGSSSSYRKAAKVGDTVGGLTVTEIGDNYATLKGAEKEYKLVIGMQMKRQDEGEWELSERSYSGGSSSTGGSTNAASSSAASDESDIVKRMMQKREQESK